MTEVFHNVVEQINKREESKRVMSKQRPLPESPLCGSPDNDHGESV